MCYSRLPLPFSTHRPVTIRLPSRSKAFSPSTVTASWLEGKVKPRHWFSSWICLRTPPPKKKKKKNPKSPFRRAKNEKSPEKQNQLLAGITVYRLRKLWWTFQIGGGGIVLKAWTIGYQTPKNGQSLVFVCPREESIQWMWVGKRLPICQVRFHADVLHFVIEKYLHVFTAKVVQQIIRYPTSTNLDVDQTSIKQKTSGEYPNMALLKP